MNKEKKDSCSPEVVFLLGAGASVDAGLPTVKELTEELETRLPRVPDINGDVRPEFGQVFDLIKKFDPSAAGNYEVFIKHIYLILDIQKDPVRAIIDVKIDPSIIDAMGHLTGIIGGEIARIILESQVSDAEYLSRFADFLPAHGLLKVFSLNYDCCLEDACRTTGIELTTGFDPETKKWNSSLFRRKTKGINLYKLHGSLRWFGSRDESAQSERFQHNFALMELKPEDRNCLPTNLTVTQEPELILGPASKIQPDDPYLSLFCEFMSSMKAAKVCVIIGYGYGDKHINSILESAFDAGVHIVDVNPVKRSSLYATEKGYHWLGQSAKDALMNGVIQSEVSKLI
jgi:hypothetical protein